MFSEQIVQLQCVMWRTRAWTSSICLCWSWKLCVTYRSIEYGQRRIHVIVVVSKLRTEFQEWTNTHMHQALVNRSVSLCVTLQTENWWWKSVGKYAKYLLPSSLLLFLLAQQKKTRPFTIVHIAIRLGFVHIFHATCYPIWNSILRVHQPILNPWLVSWKECNENRYFGWSVTGVEFYSLMKSNDIRTFLIGMGGILVLGKSKALAIVYQKFIVWGKWF